MKIDHNSRIFISGHSGLVGSSIFNNYHQKGYKNLITKTHEELDLTNQQKVEIFFGKEKPEYVIISSSRVGGISANMKNPSEFLYENLMIYNNLIWNSYKNGVKKLLFISCGCAYPRDSKQPMKEEYILSGPPEPTNEGFAIAKIAGMKLCEKMQTQYKRNFISCIPANTYGTNDHFEEEKSHVIPALIKRFHNAKEERSQSVTIWGTGRARREFIYNDDLAEAVYMIMEKYDASEPINIGSGEDVTISDLVETLKNVVGYKGEIIFDKTKPDGMPQRILDSTKIKKMGFKPKISLVNGLTKAYEYFLKKESSIHS